jgi:hypothetical protein
MNSSWRRDQNHYIQWITPSFLTKRQAEIMMDDFDNGFMLIHVYRIWFCIIYNGV